VHAVNTTFESSHGGLVHESPLGLEGPLNAFDERIFKEQLLRALAFSEINGRYDKITAAYERAYEWVFKPPGDEKIWDNFLDWLCDDTSLYWLTRNPSAGKSTLMKFTCDD
jgi:hypothetical protein